jgi:DNA-binding IclR family transcriptional regulator
MLNQSDGRHSLLQVARRSGMPLATLRRAAESLRQAGLLRVARATRRTGTSVSGRASRKTHASKVRRRQT